MSEPTAPHEPADVREDEPPGQGPQTNRARWRTITDLALGNRWVRDLLLVVGVVVGVLAFLVVPDLILGIPFEIQYWFKHPVVHHLVVVVLVLAGPARLLGAVPRWIRESSADVSARARRKLTEWSRGQIDRLPGLAARTLGVPATAAVAAVCGLQLLTWVPHYLTWPWWPDIDQFAVSALSWHSGILPYRDQLDFDFPGPIFLFYALGETVGWGGTTAFNAVDALFVVFLGVALAFWSRRRFGGALPGLIGYLPFLCYYLNLPYTVVGQRDWQAPFFVVLGLLALEALPGRPGRIASALAFGAALTFRPQVVLFLPALASAVDEGGRRDDEPWSRAVRPLAEWSVAMVVGGLLAFSPLILSGVFDDFVRAVRIARFGGSYNQVTWSSFKRLLLDELADPMTAWPITANALLAIVGPAELRRTGRTFGIALVAALIYMPISPVHHDYLILPLMLFRSIALAPLAGWLLSGVRMAAPVRFAALAAMLWLVYPGVPVYCRVRDSLRAVGTLARGDDPAKAPPGCAHMFRDVLPEKRLPRGKWLLAEPTDSYRWTDYCHLLDYLRQRTSPRTPVANLMRAIPWPVINGPAGRLTPFPAAGGFIHLWLVDPTIEDQYIEALKRSQDTVVVWVPDERRRPPFLNYPRLEAVVRRLYRPEARFGRVEVWRRIDSNRPLPVAESPR